MWGAESDEIDDMNGSIKTSRYFTQGTPDSKAPFVPRESQIVRDSQIPVENEIEVMMEDDELFGIEEPEPVAKVIEEFKRDEPAALDAMVEEYKTYVKISTLNYANTSTVSG